MTATTAVAATPTTTNAVAVINAIIATTIVTINKMVVGGAAGINDPRIEEWNRNLSAVIHLAEMELQSLGKSAATTVTYFLLYSCLLNKSSIFTQVLL